jgi:hypothetical protein
MPLVASAATAWRRIRVRLTTLARRSTWIGWPARMLHAVWMRLAAPMGLTAALALRCPLVRPSPVLAPRAQALGSHALADGMARAQALQDAAVARRFAGRYLKRHCTHPAARLARQREGACTLRQRAEPATLPIEDLDLADMAVGIGIA